MVKYLLVAQCEKGSNPLTAVYIIGVAQWQSS